MSIVCVLWCLRLTNCALLPENKRSTLAIAWTTLSKPHRVCTYIGARGTLLFALSLCMLRLILRLRLRIGVVTFGRVLELPSYSRTSLSISFINPGASPQFQNAGRYMRKAVNLFLQVYHINLSYFDDCIEVVDSTQHMLGFSTLRTRF